MKYVLDSYPQTRSFFFDDDLFIHGREKARRFAEVMRAERLVIPWGMNARADGWDEESLKTLKETGLFVLRYGIESGDQETLDRIGKSLDLREARRTLELSHALGIRNHVNVVVGLEGESHETVEKTIRFVKSVPKHSVQVSLAVPYPGTRYFRTLDENGYLATRDWSNYSCEADPVMRTSELTVEELIEAQLRVERALHLNPRLALRRIRHARDFRDLFSMLSRGTNLALSRMWSRSN